MNDMSQAPILKWTRHIAKALRACNMKIDVSDILNKVYNRELLFTESLDGQAFVIVEPVFLASNHLNIHIYLMGGKKESMVALEEMIVNYAKSVGAKKVTAITRKGFAAKNSWWRKNTSGWKNPCDWIEKEL